MNNAIANPEWYSAWWTEYLITFGKSHDDDLAGAFAMWYRGLAVMGVTRDELDAVTIRILAGVSELPAFPEQHLERIKTELRSLRHERQRKAEAAERRKADAVGSWDAWNAHRAKLQSAGLLTAGKK